MAPKIIRLTEFEFRTKISEMSPGKYCIEIPANITKIIRRYEGTIVEATVRPI